MAPYEHRTWRHDFGLPFAGPGNPDLTEGEGKPLSQVRRLLEANLVGRDLAYTVGGAMPLNPFYPTYVWSEEDEKPDNEKGSESSCNPRQLGADASESSSDSDPELYPPVPEPAASASDGNHEDDAERVKPKTPPKGRKKFLFPWQKEKLESANRKETRRAAREASTETGLSISNKAFERAARGLLGPTHHSWPVTPTPAGDPKTVQDKTNSTATSSLGNSEATTTKKGTKKTKGKNGKAKTMPAPKKTEFSREAYSENMDTSDVEEWSKESFVTLRWDPKPRPGRGVEQRYCKLDFPARKQTENNIHGLLADMEPTEFGYELAQGFFSTSFNPHEFGIMDLIEQALLPTWCPPEEYQAKKPQGRSLEAHLCLLRVHCSQKVLNRDMRYQEILEEKVLTPNSPLNQAEWPGQFGRLVITLPFGTFTGGNFTIHPPNGPIPNQDPIIYKTWGLPFLPGRHRPVINWAAYHNECQTTVAPLRSGYRISLVYNLFRVRGTSLMGSSSTTSALLDLTKLPLYQSLRALLSDEMAWDRKGGYIGFMMTHAYPHNTKSGEDIGFLPEHSLRGLDFQLYQICRELFARDRDEDGPGVPLDIQFRPVMRWPGRYFKGAKKNTMELLVEDGIERIKAKREKKRRLQQQQMEQQLSSLRLEPTTSNSSDVKVEDGGTGTSSSAGGGGGGGKGKEKEQPQTQNQQKENVKPPERRTTSARPQGYHTHDRPQAESSKAAGVRELYRAQEEAIRQGKGNDLLSSAHPEPAYEGKGKGKEMVASPDPAATDVADVQMRDASQTTPSSIRNQPKTQQQQPNPKSTNTNKTHQQQKPKKEPQPIAPQQTKTKKEKETDKDKKVEELSYPTPVIGKNFARASLLPSRQFTGDEKSMQRFMHWWASGEHLDLTGSSNQPQQTTGKTPPSTQPNSPSTSKNVSASASASVSVSVSNSEGYYIPFEEVHWLNGWGHEEVSLVCTQLDDLGPVPRMVKTCLAMIIKAPPGGIDASRKNRRLWGREYQYQWGQGQGQYLRDRVLERIEEEEDEMEE